MSWKIARGRFAADALDEETIQKLQADPETAASDHLAGCRGVCDAAAREQRVTLKQIQDLLQVALSHGHAVTLRPGLDSYDITVEIHPDRALDSDDRGRSSHFDVDAMQIASRRV